MLTNLQRDRIQIVLVSPRNPLNIGAAARAMANFGFSQLTVVAPFEAHWREAQSAIGAEALLQNATRADSLHEAIAGCTLVIGTGTLTHRKAEQPAVPLPNLASHIESKVATGARIALVFGSEKRGLTREDLSYCHLLTVIPTQAAQPSMNLGQAVAVCLYELAARGQAESELPAEAKPELQVKAEPQLPDPAITPQLAPATSAELDRLATVIEAVMLHAGYSPCEMQAANQHDLRLLLRRLQFNQADVRRALGLFRRTLHKIKR